MGFCNYTIGKEQNAPKALKLNLPAGGRPAGNVCSLNTQMIQQSQGCHAIPYYNCKRLFSYSLQILVNIKTLANA